MRGRRVLAAAVLLAVAVMAGMLSACSGGAGTGSTAGVDRGEFDALAEPEKVPVLIQEQLGYSPMVRRITLFRNGFTMQVRDRDKPDNLDDYSYRFGEWSVDPVSVSVSEIAEYEARTFPLTAVNWAAVPSLMQQALDGLDLEDEEITSVGYDKLAGDPPRVYIGVQGLRGSGSLFANADGTNVVVRRN